jgi:hypothetical protein
MATPSQFYTLIFTASSLYMNPSLESSLATLVNKAFSEVENFDQALRFEKDEDVSKELGSTGIISIAFDPVPGADRDIPIACIAAKEYEPPKIEGEEVDVSRTIFYHFFSTGLSVRIWLRGVSKSVLHANCIEA